MWKVALDSDECPFCNTVKFASSKYFGCRNLKNYKGVCVESGCPIKARNARPDSEWVDIETAPKDGTEIWGWREDAGGMLIRYCAPIDFLTDTELEEMDGESAEQEDWFFADFVAGGRLEGKETPTHWRPLPPDPK